LREVYSKYLVIRLRAILLFWSEVKVEKKCFNVEDIVVLNVDMLFVLLDGEDAVLRMFV
jgi:hypothetical protein